MWTYIVFKKSTFYAGIKTSNSLLPNVKGFMCDKAKCKADFRKYLNTHSSYSADEFFYAWRWFIVLFCKMFVVFCTLKFVYIYVFMICSKSYCLCDKFTDPWNVCIYIYIYICVCMCVCVCVCVCEHMYVYFSARHKPLLEM